jgi:hypothetical protein
MLQKNPSRKNNSESSRQIACSGFVQFLFMFQLTVKLYHWRTASYTRHVITDTFNTSLLEFIDRFVETYIGRYNIKPLMDNVPIAINTISDVNIMDLFIMAKTTLEQMEEWTQNSDLLALRDDFLAHVEQTIYLFRFQ